MEQAPTIEDDRGVDVSQIWRQLRMSVENRVQHMVDVTNKLMEVRATVRLIGSAVIEEVDGSPRFRISPDVIISWAINDTTPGIPKMERREVDPGAR